MDIFADADSKTGMLQDKAIIGAPPMDRTFAEMDEEAELDKEKVGQVTLKMMVRGFDIGFGAGEIHRRELQSDITPAKPKKTSADLEKAIGEALKATLRLRIQHYSALLKMWLPTPSDIEVDPSDGDRFPWFRVLRENEDSTETDSEIEIEVAQQADSESSAEQPFGFEKTNASTSTSSLRGRTSGVELLRSGFLNSQNSASASPIRNTQTAEHMHATSPRSPALPTLLVERDNTNLHAYSISNDFPSSAMISPLKSLLKKQNHCKLNMHVDDLDEALDDNDRALEQADEREGLRAAAQSEKEEKKRNKSSNPEEAEEEAGEEEEGVATTALGEAEEAVQEEHAAEEDDELSEQEKQLRDLQTSMSASKQAGLGSNCYDNDQAFANALSIPGIQSCHTASSYLTVQGLCTDASMAANVKYNCRGTCKACEAERLEAEQAKKFAATTPAGAGPGDPAALHWPGLRLSDVMKNGIFCGRYRFQGKTQKRYG